MIDYIFLQITYYSYFKFFVTNSFCKFYRYACSLLRQDMKQIVISLDLPDINALSKQGNKEAVEKVQNPKAKNHDILFFRYFSFSLR